ncbi:hypothetical protein V7S43_000333 [Phytophthora oleae]|uniref:Uncharacterized protein n=1 Tax=Phytophthora oleae TaxID=2107226 RepID=A0ABD3G851_9STRA
MMHRFREQPERLRLVPTSKQLENRKAFLVRSAGGWEITNHATFTMWASTKVCMSQAEFMSINDAADRCMYDMIVLDAFSVAGDVGEGTSFGVIVTTRRVFQNVTNVVRDQGDELVCATDGTDKLDFEGGPSSTVDPLL